MPDRDPADCPGCFTCARCGGEFVKERDGWSEEQAEAEALAVFGVERASEDPEMAPVCDDCWQWVLGKLGGAVS